MLMTLLLCFIERTCQHPVYEENVLMTPNAGTLHYVDDIVEFECDSGYEYDSGYREQRCLPNATWSRDQPLKCKS